MSNAFDFLDALRSQVVFGTQSAVTPDLMRTAHARRQKAATIDNATLRKRGFCPDENNKFATLPSPKQVTEQHTAIVWRPKKARQLADEQGDGGVFRERTRISQSCFLNTPPSPCSFYSPKCLDV